LEAKLPVLPTNRGFAELDELRHVMGMTQEIYEAAIPFLTLRGSARINVNAAPLPVLLALPGMTQAAAREIMRLRDAGTFPSSTNQLIDMIPSAASQTLDAERQRFNQRTIYRTDEV